MIDGYMSDAAEQTVRQRRREAVRHLLIGAPLLGGICGLAANLLTILIGLAPAPISFIIGAAVAVGVIGIAEFVGRQLKGSTGDSTNRGLTRVFGFRWVPESERRLPSWPLEPWRTAFVATLIIMIVVNGAPAAFDWELVSAHPWVSSLILGAISAESKSVLTRETWVSLLRRGRIAT